MKTTLIVIAIVAVFLYVGKFKLDLSPFKVSLGAPYEMFGYLFLVAGLVCLKHQAYWDGFDSAIDKVIELVNNMKK